MELSCRSNDLLGEKQKQPPTNRSNENSYKRLDKKNLSVLLYEFCSAPQLGYRKLVVLYM